MHNYTKLVTKFLKSNIAQATFTRPINSPLLASVLRHTHLLGMALDPPLHMIEYNSIHYISKISIARLCSLLAVL